MSSRDDTLDLGPGSSSSSEQSGSRGLLAKLLEQYRKAEKAEHLAVLVDDHNGIRLLAAWRETVTEWKLPRKKQPTDSNELWEWLWTGVRYHESLAESAKLGEAECKVLLSTAMGSKLIYPDGTISKYAQELVRDHVRMRYPDKKPGGRAKGSRDKTKRKTKEKR